MLAIELSSVHFGKHFIIEGKVVQDMETLAIYDKATSDLKFPIFFYRCDQKIPLIYTFQAELRDKITIENLKYATEILHNLDRQLWKLQDILGVPERFSEYLIRIARILKIKKIIIDGSTYSLEEARKQIDMYEEVRLKGLK